MYLINSENKLFKIKPCCHDKFLLRSYQKHNHIFGSVRSSRSYNLRPSVHLSGPQFLLVAFWAYFIGKIEPELLRLVIKDPWNSCTYIPRLLFSETHVGRASLLTISQTLLWTPEPFPGHVCAVFIRQWGAPGGRLLHWGALVILHSLGSFKIHSVFQD